MTMFQMTESTEVNEEAKKAFEVIFKQLNGSDNAGVEKALVEVLTREHRTLQQNFMRSVIVGALKVWRQDYEDGCYDGRNESSCNAASCGLDNHDLTLPDV